MGCFHITYVSSRFCRIVAEGLVAAAASTSPAIFVEKHGDRATVVNGESPSETMFPFLFL
jgi:hypothetical protein